MICAGGNLNDRQGEHDHTLAFAGVAQLVEQGPCSAQVAGSIPCRQHHNPSEAICFGISALGRNLGGRLLFTVRASSSSPIEHSSPCRPPTCRGSRHAEGARYLFACGANSEHLGPLVGTLERAGPAGDLFQSTTEQADLVCDHLIPPRLTDSGIPVEEENHDDQC